MTILLYLYVTPNLTTRPPPLYNQYVLLPFNFAPLVPLINDDYQQSNCECIPLNRIWMQYANTHNFMFWTCIYCSRITIAYVFMYTLRAFVCIFECIMMCHHHTHSPKIALMNEWLNERTNERVAAALRGVAIQRGRARAAFPTAAAAAALNGQFARLPTPLANAANAIHGYAP